MRYYKKSFLLAFAYSTAMAVVAHAETPSAETDVKDHDKTILERVMVIGHEERAVDIPGAAHYINEETLDDFSYGDVGRVLQKVPGVVVQEEEGFGNRPNIGIRGGRSERSADITLMEDGVLIAPAPYAAPAAYYFPRVSRMEGVEVRKGSSTVKFGPRTTSGAVNLISSSVPRQEQLEALAGYGSYNTQRGNLSYGSTHGNVGFVIDLGHEYSDGFKDIDIVGGDSGYSIQDAMGKLKFTSDPATKYYQSMEFKLGYTQEDSDETYLGLTEADFDADPFRRYAASQVDNMDADHQQYQMRHYIDLEWADFTTTLYRNNFKRNWYKLQSVTLNGAKEGIDEALEDSAYLAALKGQTDLSGDASNNFIIRANDREYYAQGAQVDMATDLRLGQTSHLVEAGVRFHQDEESRFQQEDRYAITGGVMSLASAGAPGSNANQDVSAQAAAFYLLDEISYGGWTFVPGMRLEHISLESENYRTGSYVKNTVDAFVPGMGVGYAFTEAFSLFGGVHKGFAPPSPGSTGDEEEESVNYELGLRYTPEPYAFELVGFFNDYENLLGRCTISSGCLDATGEQFNAGEVDVYGLEASISADIAPLLSVNNLKLPVGLAYTYTKAEFQNSFTSSFEEWGNVTAGDELPYVPDHKITVTAGVEHKVWEIHLAGTFVDEMRTTAGSGPVSYGEGTDAHFVLDASAEYEILENTRLFATADNLLDREYVAARRPAGARPGKPLTVLAGVKYVF